MKYGKKGVAYSAGLIVVIVVLLIILGLLGLIYSGVLNRVLESAIGG